jgi:hypothetical protein
VEVRPFHDRALNRDLAALCERVAGAGPRLPLYTRRKGEWRDTLPSL